MLYENELAISKHNNLYHKSNTGKQFGGWLGAAIGSITALKIYLEKESFDSIAKGLEKDLPKDLVKNITKTINGEKILDNVTFTVKPNDKIATSDKILTTKRL